MTVAHTQSTWTPALVDQLKALWPNQSASQIAGELGHGLSRNAVLGKVHRLGLAPHRGPSVLLAPKPKREPKRERAPRQIRKSGAGYVPAAKDEQPAPDLNSLEEIEAQPMPSTFLGIALIDLQFKHCRYPREISGTTFYCGQKKIEDSSYCAACHKRTHTRGGYLLNNRIAA